MSKHILDEIRRGKRGATERPDLPDWAQAFADARPASVNRWIATWSAMTGTNFRLVEHDLLEYIHKLEAQVSGIMIEDELDENEDLC